MVETLQRNSGLWHITLAQKDLVEQAGLNEEDLEYEFTHFRYKGRVVILSHAYNQHLVVSMEGEEDSNLKQIIDAFSKIVEYKPFCKYKLLPSEENKYPILPTYEWDKVDPNGRYEELSKKTNISDLLRINSTKTFKKILQDLII